MYWTVTVWDQNDSVCGTSNVATFETALVEDGSGWDDADWLARYPQHALNVSGCDLYQETDENAAPRFRTEVPALHHH